MADEPQENVAPEAPESPTKAEVQAAAAAENQAFQAAQMGYLQNRVAGLRIELNRALARIAELEAPTKADEAETQQEDPQ